MITLYNVTALLLAYMLGSVPSAVWIGKFFYGVDVREYGSGNAGATNVFRVLGKKAGIPVLILDILKGWLAVNMAYFISDSLPGTAEYLNLQLALGISAILGHIFPLYAGFRGGKGIATLVGILIAVNPATTAVAIVVFSLVVLFSGFISLGSMIAALSYPFIVIFLFPRSASPTMIIFACMIAVLVLITHQKNIERLIKRQESKMRLLKKSDSFGQNR